MQNRATHEERAQTQSRVAREPIPLNQRAAYSPAEFAALCGRSPTWTYRLIYRVACVPEGVHPLVSYPS